MSLLSFLEAGGQSVIQGIVASQGSGFAARIAANDRAAINTVLDRLDKKGYGRHGLTDVEAEMAVRRGGKSLDVANQINKGFSRGIAREDIPEFPGQVGRDTLTYTVKVGVSFPDGSKADVIVDVLADKPIGRAEISVEALRSVEEQLNIRSDPKRGSGGRATVTGTTVLSVYGGSVMPP